MKRVRDAARDSTLAPAAYNLLRRSRRLTAMKHLAYCLFPTPVGPIGLAWNNDRESRGVPAVAFLQLPEAVPQATEARIARCAGAQTQAVPPPAIAELIEKICRHLRGDLQDFRGVALDLRAVPAFDQAVYAAAANIPAGQTSTYGELAKSLGQPGAARAVGQALGRNPIPLIIPCHRVLAAGNKPGGFSAHGGRAMKARLLVIEGAAVNAYLDFPGNGPGSSADPVSRKPA